MFSKNALKYIASNKKTFYGTFLLSFFIALISSFAQFIQTVYMGKIINSVNEEFSYVINLFIIIAITMVIEVCFNFWLGFIIDKYCNSIMTNLRSKISNIFTYANYSELEKENDGDMHSIVSNDLENIRAYIESIFRIGYVPVKVVLCLVAIFLISWKLAISILIALPLILLMEMLFSSKLYKLSEEENKSKGGVSSYLLDTISFLKVIKSYNLENTFEEIM